MILTKYNLQLASDSFLLKQRHHQQRRYPWQLSVSILDEDYAPAQNLKIPFSELQFRGRLIVFEGIDGSGKSTSLQSAHDYLENNGIAVEKLDLLSPFCRQLPYFRSYADDTSTAFDGTLDQPALGLVCLADRLQRFRSHYFRLLQDGVWLICDRYAITPIAEAAALGANAEDLATMVNVASRLPKPAIGFHTTAPENVVLDRIRARPKDEGKILDPRFYRRAIQSVASTSADNEFITIDSTLGQDTANVKIFSAINAVIMKYKSEILSI
ncbi:hypothetical protein ACQZ6B_19075 [Agrobacterium vitis]